MTFVDPNTGTVIAFGTSDFVHFLKDLKEVIANPERSLPAIRSSEGDCMFNCQVDREHPISLHEGICFNFVSWLIYNKTNETRPYRPSGLSLYSSKWKPDQDSMNWNHVSDAVDEALTEMFLCWDGTADCEFPFNPGFEAYKVERFDGNMYKNSMRLSFIEHILANYE